MKKLLALLLVTLLAVAPFTVLAEGVSLTMGSWRNTDAAMVEALLAKYKEQTGVTIVFEPTQSAQYNSVLRLQLDSGTGPDLYYSRSYATGEELCTAGFSMDCSDIPGVKENFAANGVTELPKTWEEFIAVCQTLKDNGVTVFANGIASNWDILECVFLGMIPSYIDAQGRVAYESGEKKFNDPQFLEILEHFAQLVPFLPEGFASRQRQHLLRHGQCRDADRRLLELRPSQRRV